MGAVSLLSFACCLMSSRSLKRKCQGAFSFSIEHDYRAMGFLGEAAGQDTWPDQIWINSHMTVSSPSPVIVSVGHKHTHFNTWLGARYLLWCWKSPRLSVWVLSSLMLWPPCFLMNISSSIAKPFFFHSFPVLLPLLSSSKSHPHFSIKCFQSFPKAWNSPANVAFVLSHAEVSLHVVPGVSQLSGCEVADLTHEGLGSCETKWGVVHI